MMSAFRGRTRLVRGLALAAWVAVAAAAWMTWIAAPAADPFRAPSLASPLLPVWPVSNQQEVKLPSDALDGGVAWLNVRSPIHLDELRGKIVLLDFWTYCCINCHHVLPDLAKLEEKYANQLVVIGVHSPKFPAEKETENIRKKVAEYHIRHPVINDANQEIWNKFGVNSWPTLALIDARGYFVGAVSGEGHYNLLDRVIGQLVEKHRQRGELDETPLKFEPEIEKPHETGLLYPGKVLADEAGNRLFIADTGHHRIVVTDLTGKLLMTIGTGAIGREDGPADKASFHRPQGMCLSGNTLIVCDTENHMIRAVDLATGTVSTLAGTGEQSHMRRGSGPARQTGLNSPWDILEVPGKPGEFLIAMAGPHQIWELDTKRNTVGVWAGSGIENIVDGDRDSAAFAQPSGLATDGKTLFIADSEVSGVRAASLTSDRVDTIVGVHLFGFGDVDGRGARVRLQHCLGLAYGDGVLYIADTYNNKIKKCDPKTQSVQTFLGDRKAGRVDNPPRFDEPGGLSLAGKKLYIADTNNHAIRVADVDSGTVRTLDLSSVKPPAPPRPAPSFPNPTPVALDPQKVKPGANVRFEVTLALPDGYKINPDAAMAYLVESPGKTGVLSPKLDPAGGRIDPPTESFTIDVPLAQPAAAGTSLDLKLSLRTFLCRAALCEIHSVVWTIPVQFDPQGESSVPLTTPTTLAQRRTAALPRGR